MVEEPQLQLPQTAFHFDGGHVRAPDVDFNGSASSELPPLMLPQQPHNQRNVGAWFYETGSNPDDGIGSGSTSTGMSES